jgi:hypothetical protein
MFKRIALAAVAAGVLALPAVASASTLPPIGPIKPMQVKWVIGPTGHVGSGADMEYEYADNDDVTYPGPRLP